MEKRFKELEEENNTLKLKLKDLADTAVPIFKENELLRTQLANASESPTEQKVCKVSAKLPPFWPDRPNVWFAQVEAQFSISGITSDQTKFDYVIAQLDSRVIGEVEDIITQPPASDRFGYLKKELIRRLSTSEEQRVRQLVSDEVLGDRKPSQFLRHLRSLAGHVLSDQNILRQLWMRRLPQHLQAILAVQSELSLDKVAELADKIIEVSPNIINQSSNVHSAQGPSSPNFDGIMDRLEKLTKEVAEIRSRSDFVPRRRSFSRNRYNNRRFHSPSPNRVNYRNSNNGNSNNLCWYHNRFASRATKCIKPCAFVNPENTSDEQ